ncbi:MAG: hypothetical protein RLZZ156_2198, partial [Deinococcota bacterium]
METKVSSGAVMRFNLGRGLAWVALAGFIFLSVFPVY